MGDKFFANLRKQKSVAIPDGVQTFGEQWFKNSEVESVAVSASVKEIGSDTFYNCRNLKQVTFTLGSGLEKIGSRCFCKAGIEQIVLPKGVAEIKDFTF